MRGFFAVWVLALVLSLPSWAQAQDAGPQPEDNAAVAEPVAEEPVAEEPVAGEPDDGAAADGVQEPIDLTADPDLDEQTYEKDDDEFVPTEEIPVDEAIPFPADI